VTTSRYNVKDLATYSAPDGRQVPYLRRRFLPKTPAEGTTPTHLVIVGERVDSIAAAALNDAELSWQIADANIERHPVDLARPGRVIALPGAVSPYGT
jgi:hypothetical protein